MTDTFSNAWHPSKDYYHEWWYFTAFAKVGCIAGLLGVKNSVADIWVSVYGQKTIQIRKRYGLEEFSASQQECSVQIGWNQFDCDENSLEMLIDEPELGLDLKATPTVRGNQEPITHVIDSQRHSNWIVPYLRAQCGGMLRIGKEEHPIEGIFFHDHVRHTYSPSLDLALSLRGWDWGICYTDTHSLLFVDVLHKHKPFNVFLHHDGKDLEIGRQSVITHDDLYPRERYTIQTTAGNTQIDLKQQYRHSSESLILRPFNRWLDRRYHYIGDASVAGENGTAYVETTKMW